MSCQKYDTYVNVFENYIWRNYTMVKSKTKLKKIIPATMLVAVTLTFVPLSSFAAEKNDVQNNYVSSQKANKAFQPTEESITFMSKVVSSGAIKEFNFSPDLKIMTYKHDMATMKILTTLMMKKLLN